jgi:type II secretory pathway pseudopilin PulG
MAFEFEMKVAMQGSEQAVANLNKVKDTVGQVATANEKSAQATNRSVTNNNNLTDSTKPLVDGLSRTKQKMDDLGNAANQTGSKFGSMRGLAQNAGYQIQDIAVQMQMGTSAAVIFSQQGSQLVSAFNPVAGAVIAVVGALAGALLPSLFNSGKAAEEMAAQAKALTKDLKDLSEEQQKVVNTATGYVIQDETKKYNDLNKEIENQTKKLKDLNAENGKKAVLVTSNNVSSYTIDNTKAIADLNKELTANQTALVAQSKVITDLQNPHKAYLDNLRYEVNTLGLEGVALAEAKADREGLTGAVRTEAIALELLRQKKEAKKRRFLAKGSAGQNIALRC